MGDAWSDDDDDDEEGDGKEGGRAVVGGIEGGSAMERKSEMSSG